MMNSRTDSVAVIGPGNAVLPPGPDSTRPEFPTAPPEEFKTGAVPTRGSSLNAGNGAEAAAEGSTGSREAEPIAGETSGVAGFPGVTGVVADVSSFV